MKETIQEPKSISSFEPNLDMFNYRYFLNLIPQLKLKLFSLHCRKEPLLIAWYQYYGRFYEDEAEMADWQIFDYYPGNGESHKVYRRTISGNSILTGNEEKICDR